MKAIITDKAQLNWSTLTRFYTFDLVDDDGEPIVTSQTIEARPDEIRVKLDDIKTTYETQLAIANDVEVGEEI